MFEMWPKLVDYSKEECKQMLRRLELEAYSSVVNALRAQGDLNQAKAKILHDLSNMLSITLERHQAEIRRAVNDERLSTIAYHVSGEESSHEWTVAGRRLIPLLPRLIPQNQLTEIATQSAVNQATKNESLSSPSMTAFKNVVKKEKLDLHSNEISLSPTVSTSTISVTVSSPSSSQFTSTSVSPSGTTTSSTTPTKRLKLDNGSSITDSSLISPKIKQSIPTSPKSSIKSVSVISTTRTSIQLPPTYTISSTGPRVVFMSSNGTAARTLTVNDVNSSATLLTTSNGGSASTITKARVVAQGSALEPGTIFSTAKRIIRTTAKPFVTGNSTQSGMASAVTLAPGTRIIPAKSAFPQQVVVFPSNGGPQKTITIPLSQTIKQLQVPNVPGSGNAAVVYQAASNSSTPSSGALKTTIPGTITIQTFKPSPALIAISQ